MSSQKNILALLCIGIVLALVAWFVLAPTVPQETPETVGSVEAGGVASTTEAASSSTPALGGAATPKTLAPEQPFVLPAGATAIDGYAYIENGQVYFRSLTGKSALAVPNSDAESFARLSTFMTYPGSSVVSDCGVAPFYSYYGDDKQVYFYQVWRAPKFRSSTVEVIIGAKTEDFSITGTQTATDGSRLFEVGYEKAATSTCKLFLSRATL